ncbi:MAG: hypothetical protein COZ68_11450, partial [Deltaproteobacteria bacterium CG_4_8_14_3_um_filter_43_13]
MGILGGTEIVMAKEGKYIYCIIAGN